MLDTVISSSQIQSCVPLQCGYERDTTSISVLRWGTEGTEILCNLPKVTQHVASGFEIPTERSKIQSNCAASLFVEEKSKVQSTEK